MIVFENVTKIYNLTPALSDVSLEMKKSCVGLLGPNGSGKTTSLKLTSGLIKPDHGSIQVLGEDPFNNPRIMRKIGYQPELEQPYLWMTGYRYLKIVAKMYNLSKDQFNRSLDDINEFLGLNDFIDRKIGGYSRGMRQRIKLAQALIHDPDIVLLDEPLSGLDPKWRNRVLELIRELVKQGKLIVFSTHLLFDAELVCDNVIFLYRGRLIAKGSLRSLQKYFMSRGFNVKLKLKNEPETLISILTDTDKIRGFFIDRTDEKGGWVIEVYVNGIDGYRSLMRFISNSGLNLTSLEISELDLDEIYAKILRDVRGEK